MDVETALDELFSVPLEEFTGRRNAIARAAKEGGDADAAARIRSLKKPSTAAWALNQLARRDREGIAALSEIRRSLEKTGSARELRERAGQRREVVARLTARARAILEEAGHGSAASTIERISSALVAGGTKEEEELLASGRLSREPSGTGLAGLGFTPGAAEGLDAGTPVSLKDRRTVERLRHSADEAEREAARLVQEAEFAEEEGARLRRRAEEQAAVATKARKAAEDAAAGL